MLPWAIWIVGQSLLGPYAGGNVWRFFGDYFTGLAHGERVFWVVALGPALFLLLIRLVCRALSQTLANGV